MTVRARLTLLVGLSVAIVAVVAALGAYVAARSELNDEVDSFLVERASSLTALGGAFEGRFDGRGNRPGRGGGARPSFRGRDLAGVDAVTQLVDRQGAVVFSVAGEAELPVDAAALAQLQAEQRLVFTTETIDGVDYRILTRPLEGGFALQIARPLDEVNEALAGLRSRLVLLVVVVTLGAALLAWVIARQVARPIEKLATVAEHVAETEDLDASIDTEATGEVGRLARSFQAMLGALGRSRAEQQRLVMDAGHELRTPLTSLRTNVELLKRDDLTDTDRQRVFGSLESEIGELSALVGELVELSTDSATAEPFVDCDLRDIANEETRRVERRTGRPVIVTGSAAPVSGQRAALARAVHNLVDNAVKFSGGDAEVEVCVGTDEVVVLDRGPGIPEQDLPYVFDRFYRSTVSRGRPGSGLGLSIVARIAEVHGGEAFAANRTDGPGASVGFRLGDRSR